jgi:hypothetical protein
MEALVAHGKLLRISSEDKGAGQNNANFEVQLGNASFIQNVHGVVLKSMSFKHVFPNVFEVNGVAGSGNSGFTFSYNGAPLTANIPEAWYTAEDYRTQLELSINALPAVLNPITVALDSIPATSALTRKFVFTATAPDTIGLINKTDGNLAADLVGINTTTGQALTHTADWLPDFGGLSTIYLCSGILASVHCTASSNGGEQVPVVTPIPINVDFGREVHYESKDHLQDTIFFSNYRNLNTVDLRLCTRLGNTLSLQQNNLTATFRLLHRGVVPQD